MEKIRVDFETITPIWTGDAWGENSELKASSIMGSLRRAFSNYCKEKEIPLSKLNKNGIVNEIFDYNNQEIENKSIKQILKDKNISLESQLFGCTGWKSRIVINQIDSDKNGDKFKLKSISFSIDRKFLNEFNSFKQWLNRQDYIYIGKGQKKKKGGKVKILDKKPTYLNKSNNIKNLQEQNKIHKEIDEKNKIEDIKKNRKTNKLGIRKL